MKSIIIYIVMSTSIASGGRVSAQETDDHRTIRTLIDREQKATDSGDAQALLDVNSEDFIAVWVRHYDGATDWAGRSATLDDEAMAYKHNWEVVHIAIDEDDVVAISQMEHARNDTTAG